MRGVGLSIEQAPPFIVVSSFFTTACALWFVFSLFHAFLMFTSHLNIPFFIHTFTVSLALLTMFGALYQMLPVVAGAVIKEPVKKALPSYLLLLSGAFIFPPSFYLSNPTLKLLGATLMYTGSIYTFIVMGSKLYRIRANIPTSYGMKYALVLLIIGLSLGYYTILSYTGLIPFKGWVLEYHFKVLLFGWIGLLIASVSFRVVEMFYVTEPYPRFYAYRFPELLGLALLISPITDYPLLLLYLSYALITVLHLLRRKRKTSEPTIPFWYLGMLMLALSLVLYPISKTAFYYAFLMFFTSIIMGMMQRIIPFLVWFHLSNEGVFPTPLMSDVISPNRIRLSFYILVGTSFSLMSSLLWSFFLYSFALLLCLTSALLFYNIFSGSLVYFKLRKRSLWR